MHKPSHQCGEPRKAYIVWFKVWYPLGTPLSELAKILSWRYGGTWFSLEEAEAQCEKLIEYYEAFTFTKDKLTLRIEELYGTRERTYKRTFSYPFYR